MTDLISILGTLVDNKGNILIEGLGDLVAPLTEEEKALFPGIAFTMDDIYESLGSKTTIYDNTEQILMARYLTPSITISRRLTCKKMALPLSLHSRCRGRLLRHRCEDRDPVFGLGQILDSHGA